MLWLILVPGAGTQSAEANDVIKLQYVQRPPYMQQSKSEAPTGTIPERVIPIFKAAGIDIVWELTSLNRQWDAIQNPNEMTCSIGWFKTPEREKLVKFTKAIYQDQQFALLARKQISIAPTDTLESALAIKGLRILIKNKYSYGPRIDTLLGKYQPSLVLSDAENKSMAGLLVANRADVMFAAKEEAAYLLQNSDPEKRLQILTPVNMPIGEKRYIACNKLVTDELIERINRAIPF